MCNCIQTTILLGPPAEGRPGPSDDDDDGDNDDEDDVDLLCSLLSSVVVEGGRETTNSALQNRPVE